MSRFIVTGGAGFLGSHLVDRLLREDHLVLALDNLLTGNEKNLQHLQRDSRFEWIHHDVTSPWKDYGPVDGVFHLASPASPKDFAPLGAEILKVGSVGTWNALEYARKHQAWFFLASTSEVYGDPLVHPQKETYWGNVNPNGLRSVYDESKRFAESLVSLYNRNNDVQTSIVRIFNTYGPRMRPNDGRVIPNFMMQALSHQPLTAYGDGSQTRSFCYVSDLVEGFYSFWLHKPKGPINLGNPNEISVSQAAKIIIESLGSKSQVTFKPLPQDDPKQRCPDITQARQFLHWEPKVSFQEGIAKTVEYFRGLL